MKNSRSMIAAVVCLFVTGSIAAFSQVSEQGRQAAPQDEPRGTGPEQNALQMIQE